MKKTLFKFLTISLLTFILALSFSTYALAYEATNLNELENFMVENMNKYMESFEFKYLGEVGSLDSTINKIIQKDLYLKANLESLKWTITERANVSTINVEAKYITTKTEREESIKKIKTILDQIITPSMNEHEKVKAVHDYIVINSKYDTTLKFYSDYDLLYRGTSVCNGYALLTYHMLRELNIPVKLVIGTANNIPHIWNMVKFGDYYFHLDTTWDDPVPDTNTISYDYYMLTEEEISRDHVIDKAIAIPSSSKSYYSYLKEESLDGLIYDLGLDIYNENSTADSEAELINILENKIIYHPLEISVRVNKIVSQESLSNSMTKLFKNNFISDISYNKEDLKDNSGYIILNLYIKYKEVPKELVLEFTDKVYSVDSKANYSVYAIYGSKKVDVTNFVFVKPTNKDINIKDGTITFDDAGKFKLIFEYQGLVKEASITAIGLKGFVYMAKFKPLNDVNVMVFDKYIDFSTLNQWPFIENSRTLVPLRAVFEVLDCEVGWDPNTFSAVIKKDEIEIIVSEGKNIAYVNNVAKTLDVAPKIVNDRIMIPLRFVSEALQRIVYWDGPNNTVLIY